MNGSGIKLLWWIGRADVCYVAHLISFLCPSFYFIARLGQAEQAAWSLGHLGLPYLVNVTSVVFSVSLFFTSFCIGQLRAPKHFQPLQHLLLKLKIDWWKEKTWQFQKCYNAESKMEAYARMSHKVFCHTPRHLRPSSEPC